MQIVPEHAAPGGEADLGLHDPLAESFPKGGEGRVLPYGAEALEEAVRDYRTRRGDETSPEPFEMHDKAQEHWEWFARTDEAVASLSQAWRAVGQTMPDFGRR